MAKAVIFQTPLENQKAQEFMEYLRKDLLDAYEKYHENPKNRHVQKAAERFNMFMNIYIDEK